MPAPEPWLQYGALGLHALVLCGLGALMVLVLKAAGKYVNRIADALEDVGKGLTELTTYVRTKLDADPPYRDRQETLRGLGDDRGGDRSDVTKHPTMRMSRDHVEALARQTRPVPPAPYGPRRLR